MSTVLNDDPGQGALSVLLSGLSAEGRAQLHWLTPSLRDAVVLPLCALSEQTFAWESERCVVEGALLFVRVALDLGLLDCDSAQLSSQLSALDPASVRSRISQRLRGTPALSRELGEAEAWLRAVLIGVAGELQHGVSGGGLARDEGRLREEIEAELRGAGGSLWRGMVLTTAAIELMWMDVPIPQNAAVWFALANRETQAAANILRASGVGIPTRIRLTGGLGASARQGRLLVFRDRVVPGSILKPILTHYAPHEVWLFGSRARGSHSPDSDWDIFVVVDDEASAAPPPPGLLAHVAVPVDVVVSTAREFEEAREVFGTLSNIVSEQGVRVYVR